MGARRYKSLSPSKLISWGIRQGTTEVIKWHPFWGGGSNKQQIYGNFGGFALDIVHEVWGALSYFMTPVVAKVGVSNCFSEGFKLFFASLEQWKKGTVLLVRVFLGGWNLTQLCGDYFINHCKDPY